MGVSAISEKLYGYKGPKCVVKGPQEQGRTLLVKNLEPGGQDFMRKR